MLCGGQRSCCSVRGGSPHLGHEFRPVVQGQCRVAGRCLLVLGTGGSTAASGRASVSSWSHAEMQELECEVVTWSGGSPSSYAGVGWMPFSCSLGQWPPKFGQSRLYSEPGSWDGLVACKALLLEKRGA